MVQPDLNNLNMKPQIISLTEVNSKHTDFIYEIYELNIHACVMYHNIQN